MSYCRWSSDDFACDVYCYEDVNGGFTTHVASNKLVGDIPKMSNIPERGDDAGWAAWWASKQAQDKFLETAERVPIGLPHDSQSFNDPDLEAFLCRLESLKTIGYNVPDWVIASVKQEIGDEAKQPVTSPIDSQAK